MKTTIRIRGLYAIALTQLFRQYPDEWEIVQPVEAVKAKLDQDWRMVSPDVDIDDAPDERGRREIIRIAGSSETVHHAIETIQRHCFDVITHSDSLQVGAIYQGLVGIVSRVRRRATVYLGNQIVGRLPLRYEDRDMKIGTYLPVRIASLPSEAGGDPELSTSITVPGHYAVLTSTPAVRLSKQITDLQQQERLQSLGNQLDSGSWGIIWRTAAQEADDATLTDEIESLAQHARTLRERLRSAKAVGFIQGGDMVAHLYLACHAKTVCDALRAQLLPTLPGHHKYQAQGDLYASTVDALEKELPPQDLATRTKTLSLLASVDAMQPPIQNTLRLIKRNLDGKIQAPVVLQRVAEDLQEGWVDVRYIIPNKNAYPPDFDIARQRGDYTTIRFQEGGWYYISRFYDRNAVWKGTYAALTTPLAIFADELHVLDLGVAVTQLPQLAPECKGMDDLRHWQEQGIVSHLLVEKVQQEVDDLLRQLTLESTESD
jgi:hypothetical protein